MYVRRWDFKQKFKYLLSWRLNYFKHIANIIKDLNQKNHKHTQRNTMLIKKSTRCFPILFTNQYFDSEL